MHKTWSDEAHLESGNEYLPSWTVLLKSLAKNKTKVLICRCFFSTRFSGSIKVLSKYTKGSGTRGKNPKCSFRETREIMVSKQRVLLKVELMKLRFLWICVSCLIYFVSEF